MKLSSIKREQLIEAMRKLADQIEVGGEHDLMDWTISIDHAISQDGAYVATLSINVSMCNLKLTSNQEQPIA